MIRGKYGKNIWTLQDLLDRSTKEGDCLIWRGCITGSGYGQVRSNGKQVPAHRLSYQLATGEEIGTQVVHHKCANRKCINPEHLQLAQHAENLLEMMARKSLEARIADLEARVEELEAQLDTQRRGAA